MEKASSPKSLSKVTRISFSLWPSSITSISVIPGDFSLIHRTSCPQVRRAPPHSEECFHLPAGASDYFLRNLDRINPFCPEQIACVPQTRLNIFMGQVGAVPKDLQIGPVMSQQVNNKLYCKGVPLMMCLPVRTSGSITICSLQFIDLSNAFLTHKLNQL